MQKLNCNQVWLQRCTDAAVIVTGSQVSLCKSKWKGIKNIESHSNTRPAQRLTGYFDPDACTFTLDERKSSESSFVNQSEPGSEAAAAIRTEEDAAQRRLRPLEAKSVKTRWARRGYAAAAEVYTNTIHQKVNNHELAFPR